MSRASDQRGAVAVELALILPILVILIFGIVMFGLFFNRQVSLTGAARDGARVMAITNDVAAARTATINAAPGLGLTAANVTVAGACPAGATTSVTVTATRTDTYQIPLVGEWDLEASGTGVMRCGG